MDKILFSVCLQQDKPFIQKLVRPLTDNGTPYILEDLLNEMIPDVMKDENRCERFN